MECSNGRKENEIEPILCGALNANVRNMACIQQAVGSGSEHSI